MIDYRIEQILATHSPDGIAEQLVQTQDRLRSLELGADQGAEQVGQMMIERDELLAFREQVRRTLDNWDRPDASSYEGNCVYAIGMIRSFLKAQETTR